jgi:hypothetical protein
VGADTLALGTSELPAGVELAEQLNVRYRVFLREDVDETPDDRSSDVNSRVWLLAVGLDFLGGSARPRGLACQPGDPVVSQVLLRVPHRNEQQALLVEPLTGMVRMAD